MVDRIARKRQAELDYWSGLSMELTKGCTTELEKREALLRICTEVTSPRYMQALGLTEASFSGMKVLDVGCGPHGGLMLFRDCEKYGIDHLVEGYRAIGYPLEQHGITYVDCKAEETPFADGFFDAIICINALDHVDDLERTIREISRVMRPGGRFMGQFNFHERPTATEPHCLEHHALLAICVRSQLRLKKRLFQCRLQEMHEDRYFYEFEKGPNSPDAVTIDFAEGFLTTCINKGMAHSFDVDARTWVKPYPEVTGYLLSYFAQDCLEKVIPAIIIKAARKLLDVQHRNGGFPSFAANERLYTFDTAQIMHGLASLHLSTKESRWLDAATRAADFVCDMQLADGAMFPVYDLARKAAYVEPRGHWGISFSPIQTKNIEGLSLLYRVTGNRRYATAAARLADFGKLNCDLTYTHPGAYCLEGLLSAGEDEFVREKLRGEILPRLLSNGFLSYAPDLPYAYVSGSIQMGILLFKTGFLDESRQILLWARRVQQQHSTGGLFQYADAEGNLDRHVHTEINSWGTKYFCQLERLWACGC